MNPILKTLSEAVNVLASAAVTFNRLEKEQAKVLSEDFLLLPLIVSDITRLDKEEKKRLPKMKFVSVTIIS